MVFVQSWYITIKPLVEGVRDSILHPHFALCRVVHVNVRRRRAGHHFDATRLSEVAHLDAVGGICDVAKD